MAPINATPPGRRRARPSRPPLGAIQSIMNPIQDDEMIRNPGASPMTIDEVKSALDLSQRKLAAIQGHL